MITAYYSFSNLRMIVMIVMNWHYYDLSIYLTIIMTIKYVIIILYNRTLNK